MTIPRVTEELRAEARANPGTWIYAIDPVLQGTADVPPQGIIGAWRADEDGRLGDEFTPNPNYVPSPTARGWPPPASRLEHMLQIVLAGHAPSERLAQEIAAARVFVFSRPEGGLFLAPAEDGGGRLVYAFTDEAKAKAAGSADNAEIGGADLAASVPEGVRIVLNAGEELSAVVDAAQVRAV